MPKRHLLTVRPSPLDHRKGILAAGPLRVRCALGRSGTTILKREGDGASPVGTMALLSAWRRGRRVRGLVPALPWQTAGPRDGWCDEPGHACYNRPVRLPIAASAETMQRGDRLYDFVIVLDWNYRSRRRGLGSAIFLHVAKPGYPPTQGCVAVAPLDMVRLLPFLRKGSRLRIARSIA